MTKGVQRKYSASIWKFWYRRSNKLSLLSSLSFNYNKKGKCIYRLATCDCTIVVLASLRWMLDQNWAEPNQKQTVSSRCTSDVVLYLFYSCSFPLICMGQNEKNRHRQKQRKQTEYVKPKRHEELKWVGRVQFVAVYRYLFLLLCVFFF